MTPHHKPKLGESTYLRDTLFNSTVTDGDEKKEVMLPNWSTPMAEALCKTLGTPQEVGKHIRAGVERIYQCTDLGDGYIHGAGCDLTISKEEEDRKNQANTDNGRIKMVSTAEKSLVPLILTVYHHVCNKLYGNPLAGASCVQKRKKGAKFLHDWYTKHATGTGRVPSKSEIVEGTESFLKRPPCKWEDMEWYKDLPRPQQALQEKDPNAGTTGSTLKDDGSAKRGTKRSSPASSASDNNRTSKAAKKDNSNHVYTADELSDIQLEGEETEETPIFDTCSDVRRKLNDTLKHTTKANLARTLDAVLPNSGVTAKQLTKFLEFKGVQGGAHSPAFYAGYVYFEKIRVKEDKKKGKKREKMEEIWGGAREEERFLSWHSKGSRLGGFPREGDHNARMTMVAGDGWKLDQYGQVIHQRRDGTTQVG